MVAGGKEKRDRNKCFSYLFFYFLFFIFFSQIHSPTELGSHSDGLGLTYKWNTTIGSTWAESVWVAFRLRNFSKISVRIVGAISWKGDGELLQITGAGEIIPPATPFYTRTLHTDGQPSSRNPNLVDADQAGCAYINPSLPTAQLIALSLSPSTHNHPSAHLRLHFSFTNQLNN